MLVLRILLAALAASTQAYHGFVFLSGVSVGIGACCVIIDVVHAAEERM